MNEHDPKGEERVEDLDVPKSESEDVKGGLLPAVHDIRSQKVQKVDIAEKWSPGGAKFGDGSV
jgi:hypothetical protein